MWSDESSRPLPDRPARTYDEQRRPRLRTRTSAGAGAVRVRRQTVTSGRRVKPAPRRARCFRSARRPDGAVVIGAGAACPSSRYQRRSPTPRTGGEAVAPGKAPRRDSFVEIASEDLLPDFGGNFICTRSAIRPRPHETVRQLGRARRARATPRRSRERSLAESNVRENALLVQRIGKPPGSGVDRAGEAPPGRLGAAAAHRCWRRVGAIGPFSARRAVGSVTDDERRPHVRTSEQRDRCQGHRRRCRVPAGQGRTGSAGPEGFPRPHDEREPFDGRGRDPGTLGDPRGPRSERQHGLEAAQGGHGRARWGDHRGDDGAARRRGDPTTGHGGTPVADRAGEDGSRQGR